MNEKTKILNDFVRVGQILSPDNIQKQLLMEGIDQRVIAYFMPRFVQAIGKIIPMVINTEPEQTIVEEIEEVTGVKKDKDFFANK